MSDLISRVRQVLGEFRAGGTKNVLEGPTWSSVRSEIKQWIALLDVNGHRIVAGRLEHDYAALSDEMRQIASTTANGAQSMIRMADLSTEFLTTVNALTLPCMVRLWESSDEQKGSRKKGLRPPTIYDVPNPDREFAKKVWYSPGLARSLIGLASVLEKEPNRTAAHARLDTLLPAPPSKIYNDIKRYSKSLNWWNTWIINNDGIYTLKKSETKAKQKRNGKVQIAKR